MARLEERMEDTRAPRGRLRLAPENHLDATGISRRRFLAGVAAGGAALATTSSRADDQAIMSLPEHSRSLGQPVAARGYGSPSKYEGATQRRDSPGLTRTALSSIAFAPLQSLFGIITPSGLHFERHHSGWYDIDPAGHRQDGSPPGLPPGLPETSPDSDRNSQDNDG